MNESFEKRLAREVDRCRDELGKARRAQKQAEEDSAYWQRHLDAALAMHARICLGPRLREESPTQDGREP